MPLQYIADAPKIHVEITTDGDSVTQVALRPHTFFSLSLSTHTSSSVAGEIKSWLLHYALKNPQPLPTSIVISSKRPFSDRVIASLLNIGFGTTVTYQQLAEMAGSPLACRAAGNICRDNLFPLFVPCHRVVKKGNDIGEFAFSKQLKEELIHFEKNT